MLPKKTIILLLLLVFSSLSSLAMSHSGRTNSKGCHAGKEPYHCHSSSISSVGSGGNSIDDSNGAMVVVVAVVAVVTGLLYLGNHISPSQQVLPTER
ncbi:MAG: hypothetical protein KAG20_07820 [Cocleimonas sp.]|nr:hypothetical protein [Cocleimonas sp.]